MSILDKYQERLETFQKKLFEEMAAELGVAKPGTTLGMSIDDDIVLDRLPTGRPEALSGFWTSKTHEGEAFTVEVVSYNPINGMVIVEYQQDGNLRTSMMEYELFVKYYTLTS